MAGFIYPELSYRLIGILYAVYNRLGGGYQEKYYQKAIRQELLTAGIPFLEQIRCDLFYQKDPLGLYRLDFIIDHKIVLEIKIVSAFSKRDTMQVLNYLKHSNLKLGILASFSRNSIFYKRILKGKPSLSN